MQEQGVVISSDAGQVTVELNRSSACDKCGGCSVSPKGTMHAVAHNSISASVGETVILVLDEAQLLRAAAIVYLLPLFAAVLGFILLSSVASMFTQSTMGIGALGAIIALGAAFIGVSRYDRKAGRNGTYSFRIERESMVTSA